MRMRIVLAVAATVAALVTAGPVTAAVAAPAAGVASAAGAVRAVGYVPHRCYVSELAGRFHGAQAGLGNRGFLLTLTNVSGASCRVDGYPGLQLRGVADRPAVYLEISPPGAHRGIVLRIPGGAALVYRGRVDVTALARHTRYYP